MQSVNIASQIQHNHETWNMDNADYIEGNMCKRDGRVKSFLQLSKFPNVEGTFLNKIEHS
jgi:hypothetical protein